jgi:hypothetical protein
MATKKEAIDAAILASLSDLNLTYNEIAAQHRVGINRVWSLAVIHNLRRKRGPKPRPMTLSTVQE